MFCWHPARDKLNQCFESTEREFAVTKNKSPTLSKEDWLQKHIFTDIHTIFFATYGNELYSCLSKLIDQHIFKKKRNIVWTPELIQTVRSIDNPISRAVDFWLASVLEGFITEFAVEQRKHFNEAERYFFKGYHGKYLNSLNLFIKMILHEKGVLDVYSDV